MNFDEEDLENLRTTGVSVRRPNGMPLRSAPKAPPTIESTLRRLADELHGLTAQLEEMLKKQSADHPAAAAEPVQESRPRKWRFSHSRDEKGKITETVAEAED